MQFNIVFHVNVTNNEYVITIAPGASFFFGVRIRLGTIFCRFSIIYFRGLGFRIRIRVRVRVRARVRVWVRVGIGVWVRVSVVLWSW